MTRARSPAGTRIASSRQARARQRRIGLGVDARRRANELTEHAERRRAPRRIAACDPHRGALGVEALEEGVSEARLADSGGPGEQHDAADALLLALLEHAPDGVVLAVATDHLRTGSAAGDVGLAEQDRVSVALLGHETLAQEARGRRVDDDPLADAGQRAGRAIDDLAEAGRRARGGPRRGDDGARARGLPADGEGTLRRADRALHGAGGVAGEDAHDDVAVAKRRDFPAELREALHHDVA